jgi:hypothetical protein
MSSTPKTDILTSIVSSFVQKERRNRFYDLLASKKRYDDFLDDLLRDPRYFEADCIVETASAEQSAANMLRQMKKLGAGKEVYVASSELGLDGRFLDIEYALNTIVGSGSESLIFCPVSRCGYYEGHENWRYILRPSSHL